MEHESDDMDGSVSNPEEEELNESEYGGSGDDDEERRTPLDGELSNDDEPSDAPALFGLATGAPHMMHLPPTLTPHTAAVSGASQESKYAFEEHYGKHFSINNLAAAWMTEMTKPNGGKNTEFSRDFKVLYELSNEPKRKEFLDDLFSFMQKRGTPVNRIPIMAKQVLDLFELYRLVVSRGGLVEVINKKIWREITKGLNLPSSITSAAFTLRTQYMKYLYPYECEKEKLSQPDELQAAIDGNRREGRRSSYSHYAEMMSTAATAASLSASRGSNHHTSPISLVCRQANGHAPSFCAPPRGRAFIRG
ncbi:hypothetical protein MRX96_006537 [Rhipicephalus microplus]